MTSPSFVHLSLHTEYSLIDSVVRVKPLAARARELGMAAIGVSDAANMYGSLKFQQACINQGIKPIFGVEFYIRHDDAAGGYDSLLLYAINTLGYQALSRLLSRAYRDGQASGRACLHAEWLEGETDHLIALSGGLSGALGRHLIAGHADRAEQVVQQAQALFADRYYIEIARTGHADESAYIAQALDMAESYSAGVVATNNVCFLHQSEHASHEIRVCVNEGRTLDDTRRVSRHTDQQYLKTVEQMCTLFSDVPQAIANTVEIAQRCNMRMETGETYMPQYPLDDDRSPDEELVRLSTENLHEILTAREFTEEQREPYLQRLSMELDVINGMGYAGYFLIVADFIRWSREHDIPVGPGRGSGAGSLVAWVSGITQLDPIEHILLFERFLNPERVSLPDFDIDFCMDGRDRVIEYVAERYGRDRVAQIITHGTMAARAVIRDVGRVMAMPFGFVDTLAKQIPFEIGMTLTKALEQEEALRSRRDNETEVEELLGMGLALEGISRNVGKHAGGVVISPQVLTNYTPLYFEAGQDQGVTQLDKDDLESVGLVKFDFLGLRTLTIIDKAERAINARREREGKDPLPLNDLSTTDPKAYKLLLDNHMGALFQLESNGMRALVLRLKPDRFDDLVALLALFRPGPLQSGMVDDFVDRKHGRQSIEYPHPDLEAILAPTYGVILYQEQVMQIAQVLAGYTLGSADMLRRAMGKKKPEEMAKQRGMFVSGASERGVDQKVSGYIFDLMEKFAGYGFNKSHSAAYALITYRTAWLKAHYPAEFMAAALSSDMDNTDRVVSLIHECREMHIAVVPPDVNRCQYEFTAVNDKQILYGLGALKGVGRNAVDEIIECRDDGAYRDLFDFCERLGQRKVNRRTIESMLRSGAFDSTGVHRASLMASLTDAMGAANQKNEAASLGQNDMFGVEADVVNEAIMKDIEPWTEEVRLQNEKETLGLYLTGHPIEQFRRELSQVTGGTLKNTEFSDDKRVTVAGIIITMRVLNTRRGDKMAFVSLDDSTARLELSINPETYANHQELIRKDALLIVGGVASLDERTGGWQVRAQEVSDIHSFREKNLQRIVVHTHEDDFKDGLLTDLATLLHERQGGNTDIWCRYIKADKANGYLRLGEDWRVSADAGLIAGLKDRLGKDRVYLDYRTVVAERNVYDEIGMIDQPDRVVKKVNAAPDADADEIIIEHEDVAQGYSPNVWNDALPDESPLSQTQTTSNGTSHVEPGSQVSTQQHRDGRADDDLPGVSQVSPDYSTARPVASHAGATSSTPATRPATRQ